jgi:hypothetical protein
MTHKKKQSLTDKELKNTQKWLDNRPTKAKGTGEGTVDPGKGVLKNKRGKWEVIF